MYRSCPFCTHDKNFKIAPFYATYYNEIKYSYIKCSQCKIVYLDPIPSNSTLDKIYDGDLYHSECYKLVNYNQYKIGYKETLINLKKFLTKNDNFLDYGCGSGFLLRYLNDLDYSVEGVEFDKRAAESAKINSLVNVYLLKDFDNIKKKYDFIYLGDVFEHTGNPIYDIKNIVKKIKSGGYLCIEGPIERNISLSNFAVLVNSKIKKYTRKNTIIVQEPYHLSFFSRKQLQNFFNQFKNMKIVSCQVYETGWPLLGSTFFKNFLAIISIFIAKIPFLSIFYGNRIRLILKITDEN